jgi:hypothetical protein
MVVAYEAQCIAMAWLLAVFTCASFSCLWPRNGSARRRPRPATLLRQDALLMNFQMMASDRHLDNDDRRSTDKVRSPEQTSLSGQYGSI